MMRLVAVVTNRSRLQVLERIYPGLEVFEGTKGTKATYRQVAIPDTYHRLEVWAIEQGLGRETIIIQDDVWMPHGDGVALWNEELGHELVVFGSTDSTGRICPKAYSASPAMHRQLVKDWDGTTRICEGWRGTVLEHGLVLNVTRELFSQTSV